MKHNRIMFTFAVLMSMVALSGCMDMKNLSEEHANMIAEYSAGVLLRYSDTYERRLITKEQLAKEQPEEKSEKAQETPAAVLPTPTPASASTTTSASSGTAVQAEETSEGGETAEEDNRKEVPLNNLYHANGLDFSYHSYQFCDKYTEKGTDSTIMAGKGETLLVVSFHVRNTSGAKKKVNLVKRNIEYQLVIDGMEYLPGINILKNGGMNFLNTTISKGKTETAVLIYTVSAERKKASEIKLVAKDGNKKTSIQMK